MASSGHEARYCRCGARLARDNDAPSCRMCERTALSGPPRPPAEFWTTEAFDDAFADRHIGRVLTAYRRHPWHGGRGVSQALLADWLQTSQPQISRAETGPAIRDLGVLIGWAQALNASLLIASGLRCRKRTAQEQQGFRLAQRREQCRTFPRSRRSA